VGQFTTLGEGAKRYKVLNQIEAGSGAYKLVMKTARNYVGFIAEGPPDADGGVDIAIVFRGTITNGEWFQDAKALKVRWREGEQPSSPPDEYLTAFPFYSHFSTALATSIGAFVLLGSRYSTGPLEVLTTLLSRLGVWCSAQHTQPLAGLCLLATTLSGLLGSVWGHGLTAMKFLLFDILNVNDVDPTLLSTSALVGLVTYITLGIVSAPLDKPNEWTDNVKKLVGVLGLLPQPWAKYGAITWWDSLFGSPRSDARLEFGFKEMYCDSLEYKDKDKAPKDSSLVSDECKHDETPPPQLTVYQTLNTVLNKYATARAKEGGNAPWVKSITTTGHSLGGALASLCGFDLATAIKEARGQPPTGSHDDALELYCSTREERKKFVEAMQDLSKLQQEVPQVAVVSFAAPRVGDLNYAKALGHRTVMCPLAVMEPCKPGFWSNIPVLLRDWRVQVVKMPWYLTAWLQEWWHRTPTSRQGTNSNSSTQASTAGDAVDAAAGSGDDSEAAAADAGLGVGMLRLVNTHDVVPKMPFTAPLPGFFYVHGGYELLLNSYAVQYLKNTWLGADIGNRHNLEMYLHLLDSSRDKALVNKSADLLIK